MSGAIQNSTAVQARADDWVCVPRKDLYELLDSLTTMQATLMPLWDPEATIHPMTDSRRRHALNALQAAIAHLTQWIEQERLVAEQP